MNRIVDKIEKYKHAIIATIGVYVVLFMYLQMDTYTQLYPIVPFHEGAYVEEPEVEVKPENIEIPADFEQGEVKNMARDVNDDRKKSNQDYYQNKSAKEIEDDIQRDIEATKASTGGEEKRKAILEEMAKRKENQSKNTNEAKVTKTQGGNTAFKGNVMVDWSLSGRDPFQKNNWWVRNPGYTCGYGSSGRVTVKIKVNKNGTVTDAVYDPSRTSGANGCMIEQAENYAKKSRFDFSSNAPASQEGVIVYTFVSQ